jgi:hypothetical protein
MVGAIRRLISQESSLRKSKNESVETLRVADGLQHLNGDGSS